MELRDLASSLASERTIRQNKEEYECLARKINECPDRYECVCGHCGGLRYSKHAVHIRPGARMLIMCVYVRVCVYVCVCLAHVPFGSVLDGSSPFATARWAHALDCAHSIL